MTARSRGAEAADLTFCRAYPGATAYSCRYSAPMQARRLKNQMSTAITAEAKQRCCPVGKLPAASARGVIYSDGRRRVTVPALAFDIITAYRRSRQPKVRMHARGVSDSPGLASYL